MGRKLVSALGWGVVSILGCSVASAANIGVDIVGSGTNDTLTSTQTAGVVSQSNWNNTTAGVKSGPLIAYADTAPSSYVLFNYSGTSTYNAINGGGTLNTANGDEVLNNGGIYSNGTGTPNTVTITGIASVGSTYNVYAYLITDHPADINVTLTPTGGTAMGPIYVTTPNANATGYFDNSASGFTYTPGTSTTAASPTVGADYVSFTLPSSVSSFTLSEALTDTTAGATNGALDGVQLTGVVPEPASVAFFGITALGLLLRRRGNRN
ncbi:MAG TPA: PEP-CTERM sorting domain-containing protein [Tepidisphaeraceae bacterium]|nr:PEP-CTERM sorting domain-containing protein [Tepidisphaeraceae bacterium]